MYSLIIITAWHIDDNVMYFIIITGSSISYPILFGGVNISYSSYACSNINLRELESNWTEKATSCFTKQNENNTADSHYLKKLANTHTSTHIQNIANWKKRLLIYWVKRSKSNIFLKNCKISLPIKSRMNIVFNIIVRT